MTNIWHREGSSEFVLLQAEQEATLKYQLVENDHVEFLSTYVPFALRGKGLAETLVQEGLRWARKNDYKISSRCWYVDRFL